MDVASQADMPSVPIATAAMQTVQAETMSVVSITMSMPNSNAISVSEPNAGVDPDDADSCVQCHFIHYQWLYSYIIFLMGI